MNFRQLVNLSVEYLQLYGWASLGGKSVFELLCEGFTHALVLRTPMRDQGCTADRGLCALCSPFQISSRWSPLSVG